MSQQELDDFFAEMDAAEYDYWLEAEEAEWARWVAEGGDAGMDQIEAENKERR